VNPSWVERYRDEHLLIVDKPPGLASQAGRDNRSSNLFDALRAQETYVGLHHRLDTPVSGLMLFSLSRDVNKAVTDGFRRHEIQRVYRGFALGVPNAEGTWDSPIDDRSACTRFRRLGGDHRASFLEFTLETGRKHQIRRHAAAAGHPLLGDRRYGGSAGTLHSRVALHAYRLTWTHPITRQPIDVEAPTPDDLLKLATVFSVD